MKNKTMIGHILAFVCIMIWGSTFVSSKILLDNFTPIELLFIRFLIGFLEYIKIDRDKSTFKSHRDFDSEIEMTFKHF